MANFPQDQFDEVPPELRRVGAHRAPRPKGRGAIAFAWAALATGVLVVGGLYGLSRVNPDITFALPDFGGGGADPTETVAPTASAAAPVTDPATVPKELDLSISIFNASSANGVQNVAGDAIKAAKWPNPSRNLAEKRDIATTTVYYAAAEYEGIARGLLQLLGVQGSVSLTDKYFSKVTIVLGEDYATLVANTG